jgi:hypothetical protein
VTLEEAFALTAAERARLDAAPFRGADERGWALFAGQMQKQILSGYAEGEMDLRRALEVMRACSLGCAVKDRIVIMANMVEQALRTSPRTLNRKRPPHPTWLRRSAATLVQVVNEQSPDQPIAPHHFNEWTTPTLETAIAWLTALGMVDPAHPVRPRTLYEWYREHRDPSANTSTP